VPALKNAPPPRPSFLQRTLRGRRLIDGSQAAPPDSSYLVSIGLFSKDRRPDLIVTGADGVVYPLLRNDDIVFIFALALTRRLDAHVRQKILDLKAHTSDTGELLQRWHEFAFPVAFKAIEQLLIEPGRASKRRYKGLRSFVDALCASEDEAEAAVGVILRDAEWLWRILPPLTTTLHLLVAVPLSKFDPTTDALYQLNLTYTDSWYAEVRTRGLSLLPDGGSDRASALGEFIDWCYRRREARPQWLGNVCLGLGITLARLSEQLLVRLMTWVGVVGMPYRIRIYNAHHCRSHYLLLDLPDDVGCTRFYWTASECLIDEPTARQVLSGYEHLSGESLPHRSRTSESVEPVLRGSLRSTQEAGDTNEAVLELQVDRSASMWMLGGVALLLSLVSGYFFRHPVFPSVPRAHLMAPAIRNSYRQVGAENGALLVAGPAALTAILLTRSSELGAYLTRGIRLLSAIATSSAVVAALAIAILLPGDRQAYNTFLLTSAILNWVAASTILASMIGRFDAHQWLTKRRLRRSAAIADSTRDLGRGVFKPKHLRRSGAPADSRYRQRRMALLGAFACAISTDLWWHALHIDRSEHLLNVTKGHAWQTLNATWARQRYTATATELLTMRHHPGQIAIALGTLAIAVSLALWWLHQVGAAERDEP
jgi:hypothetical protein